MPKEAIQQQRAVVLLYLPVSNIPWLISESLLNVHYSAHQLIGGI